MDLFRLVNLYCIIFLNIQPFFVVMKKCLEFYDMDSEKVINMILEDCLPPELTQYDKNLSTISDYDINNFEDNATGYDASDKR